MCPNTELRFSTGVTFDDPYCITVVLDFFRAPAKETVVSKHDQFLRLNAVFDQVLPHTVRISTATTFGIKISDLSHVLTCELINATDLSVPAHHTDFVFSIRIHNAFDLAKEDFEFFGTN